MQRLCSSAVAILALCVTLLTASGPLPLPTSAASPATDRTGPAAAECPARTGLRVNGWANPLVASVVARFGTTPHPTLGYPKLQPGTDLATTARGAQVRAMGAGAATVTRAERGGFRVVVDHGAGVTSSYGRLRSTAVDQGEDVSAGQVLGDARPRATVRIGVTREGDPVDPEEFLARRDVKLGVTPVSRIVGQEEVAPRLAEPGSGRSGSGLALGSYAPIEGPAGAPLDGSVTAAVANIPNRTSDSGFVGSLRGLAGRAPDFMLLNEVGARSSEAIASAAPGYGVYRDPVVDTSRGGVSQSMNNVVLWRSDTWQLIDGGRVKVVDDDQTFHQGGAVTWDRYATWSMLQRDDGAVVSLISTHMMTNPGRVPQQHGNPGQSRISQFSGAMDLVLGLAGRLSDFGPVLVGGDMNSHGHQGSWTAEAKMTAAGYGFAKDRAVMYLFHPPGSSLVSSSEVAVASDHPAVVAEVAMNGLGPGEPVVEEPTVPKVRTLTLPSGPELDRAQLAAASTVIDRVARAGLPREAAVTALAVALRESGLDADRATGLFDQTSAGGWGTPEQISDPAHAADAFLGVADGIDRDGLSDLDWQAMPVAAAGAAVQGEPFPADYATNEDDARFIVQQVTGTYFPGYDACGRPATGSCPATPWVAVEKQLGRDLREVLRCVSESFPRVTGYVGQRGEDGCVDGLDVVLDRAVGRTPRARTSTGEAVASYLIRNADQLGVRFLLWNGGYWAADGRGWRPYLPAEETSDEDESAGRDLMFERHVHVALDGEDC